MKTILSFIAVICCTAIIAQSKGFDSTLARKVGADQNGMKKYVLVILKTAAGDSVTGKKREKLFEGHFANINDLASRGLLAVAGPISKNDKNYRGVFVLNVRSQEEARNLCEADPTVKEGIFSLELFDWYASAAMMEVNRIHHTLMKE